MDTKEKLALLIALQDKDTLLDQKRLKALDIPKAIDEEKAAFEKIRTEIEDTKKSLTKLQLAKKEKELELESKEAAIRKHSAELNAVKSNDAYKALLSEIDGAKKGKSALENEILDIMEGIEKEALVIKENEKLLKAKEGESASRIAALQEELKKIEAEIAHLEAERKVFGETIPRELISRYEDIRESRGGCAIVPIDGENCGGCQMVLRPQVINDVCKNSDIVVCDSCSRILFRK